MSSTYRGQPRRPERRNVPWQLGNMSPSDISSLGSFALLCGQCCSSFSICVCILYSCGWWRCSSQHNAVTMVLFCVMSRWLWGSITVIKDTQTHSEIKWVLKVLKYTSSGLFMDLSESSQSALEVPSLLIYASLSLRSSPLSVSQYWTSHWIQS